MNIKLSILAAVVCVLFPVFPLMAANAPAGTNKKTAKTAAAFPSAWPRETLSGKITMVLPDRNVVVVQTPDGVAYDMDVTAKTRIQFGDRSIAIKDLMGNMNKQVSVEFIPERRGDVARSIKVSG